jgi:hypothetical protein
MGITSASVPSSGDVIQVVRRVVGQLEPDQLESVDPVAKAWVSGDLDRRRPKLAHGGGVGSGVEEYLLAELLFPIVSGAFGDVLGAVALEPKRFRWKKKQRPPAPDATEGKPTGPSALAPPAGEEAVKLRAACVKHARALGMSAARAEVLADAIIGSMTR